MRKKAQIYRLSEEDKQSIIDFFNKYKSLVTSVKDIRLEFRSSARHWWAGKAESFNGYAVVTINLVSKSHYFSDVWHYYGHVLHELGHIQHGYKIRYKIMHEYKRYWESGYVTYFKRLAKREANAHLWAIYATLNNNMDQKITDSLAAMAQGWTVCKDYLKAPYRKYREAGIIVMRRTNMPFPLNFVEDPMYRKEEEKC
jgi:hypothetical protein